MLDAAQIVPCVNIWDVLRTPVSYDWRECDANNLPRQLPTFVEYFAHDGNLNLTQSSSTFAGYLAHEGDLNLIQIQPSLTFAEYFARQGSFSFIQIQPSHIPVKYSTNNTDLNLIQPNLQWTISPDVITARGNTQAEPRFDFGCNVVASAVEVLVVYISESERQARESWKRFYRKHILSSAVSKDGHLSFLVPRHRQVCVETAARDQVVHLEVITLAEEQEAPGVSAVGQMLISGGKPWKRWRSRLSNLFSRFLRKTLPAGFTAGGLGFASVESLLQY
jgi:hypothetical protein